MSSKSVQSEINDKIMQATYNWLSALADISKAILESRYHNHHLKQQITLICENISKNNHERLLDKSWYNESQTEVERLKKVSMYSYYANEFFPELHSLLDEMVRSFQDPLGRQ